MLKVIPCSPCRAILFGTKPICCKHMCRLVGIRCFYIRWRIYCIWNHAQLLSGFPYGIGQHVSVVHYVFISILNVMFCQVVPLVAF